LSAIATHHLTTHIHTHNNNHHKQQHTSRLGLLSCLLLLVGLGLLGGLALCCPLGALLASLDNTLLASLNLAYVKRELI
jgi:hypothetical protein